jgi:heat shock protein HslJ
MLWLSLVSIGLLASGQGPLLSGTTWTATVIENDFAVGRRPTIQFREDGKVVGTTGCTVYFASGEIAGDGLRIRNLQLEPESSRPGTCDSLHKDQQARFLAALESTRLIRVRSGKAILLDAEQNLLVLLERRDDPHLSRHDPINGIELGAVDTAVVVTRAPRDNPFELREGDVIHSVNGRRPANPPHALRILSSYPPGTTLDLQIQRQGEPLTLRVTLTE